MRPPPPSSTAMSFGPRPAAAICSKTACSSSRLISSLMPSPKPRTRTAVRHPGGGDEWRTRNSAFDMPPLSGLARRASPAPAHPGTLDSAAARAASRVRLCAGVGAAPASVLAGVRTRLERQ
eukprot:Amastigsp_a851756_13.p4 type:complete len:122 gc:universal Amastigsp_a851756_13:684-1049(+)